MKRYIALLILLTGCKSVEKQSYNKRLNGDLSVETVVNIPYQEMGWSDEEAATYLIDKFTYGETPELKKNVLQMGVNAWLSQQLNPTENLDFKANLENRFPVTGLSMQEIAETYPGLIVTLKTIAVNSRINGLEGLGGQINFNEMFGTTLRHVQNVDKIWFYEMQNGELLEKPMKQLKLGNFMDLMYQMSAQKMYRATHSKNQLEEKLVDFWFNHFNVSITRINDVATNVLSYEQDAIRPYILGNFKNMLEATAQHPAMLTYLDNTISNASKEAPTLSKSDSEHKKMNSRQKPGINENYARELLELHTLGVDGGYTQKDIEEVARILTGWKTSPLLYPIPDKLKAFVKSRATNDGISKIDNGFYFDASRHDSGSKVVLGKTYPANQGISEGIVLFEQLVNHPSTAKHISKKMATYFVDDKPDSKLIQHMEQAFIKSNGNLKLTLKSMLESPEFWNEKYKKAKAKSPFEFVVSTLRKCDAQITDFTKILQWSSKMGQPLYAFQPPTGYPTYQAFWLNEAAIAQRIKFSYLLSQNKIDGVELPNQITNQQILATQFVSPEFQKR